MFIPFTVFFICILQLWLVFLLFSISWLMFSVCSSILPCQHFFDYCFELWSDRVFTYVSFTSCFRFSCSFGWNIFLCLFICLVVCVCFYILGSSAMSPGLQRMVLCMGCPMEPRIAIPCDHQSTGVPCVGCVQSPIVAGSWVLQVHWWVGLAVRTAVGFLVGIILNL